MPEHIKDGTGSNTLAKVSGNNRLYTASVTQNESENAVKDGRAYNINTGEITLTNDTDTPVLYLKNNEDEALHIGAMAMGIGYTTGGSQTEPVKITIIRNPKTGTIVSGVTAVDINSNRNYGSANSLTVDAYKGATGLTMTDGEDHILFYQTDLGRLYATIVEYLPKGTTIGIKIQPPTGNTSMTVYAALICHLEDAEG